MVIFDGINIEKLNKIYLEIDYKLMLLLVFQIIEMCLNLEEIVCQFFYFYENVLNKLFILILGRDRKWES